MKRNNLFLGIFFIFLGTFFLLNNLNIIDFSVWNAIFDLWPLFFVIFGIHLLSKNPIVNLVSWIAFFAIIIIYAIFKQDAAIPFNFFNFNELF